MGVSDMASSLQTPERFFSRKGPISAGRVSGSQYRVVALRAAARVCPPYALFRIEPDSLGNPGIIRSVDPFERRDQSAIGPCLNVDSLPGDKITHINDLHELSLPVLAEDFAPKTELNGPAFTRLASRQVVRIPLETDI